MTAFAQLIANIAQKPIQTDVSNCALLISFGYLWQKPLKNPNTPLFILHPLFAPCNPSSQSHTLRYEIGTEFGVVWLLAYILAPLLKKQSDNISKLKDKLKNLDVGFLSSETNLSEEELEQIREILCSSSSVGIVLGEELATHPHTQDIALVLGILGTSNKIEFIMPQLKNPIMPHSTHIENTTLSVCEELPESNGHFIYILPSNISMPILKTPPLFAPALKLNNQQKVVLKFESQHIPTSCEYDSTLKGTIALLYMPKTQDIGYPYKKVEVIL
ncbi:hypothetical protein OQH61_06000 [Helicobacter sp. MIT 21-1697]|uniref:hypothetical protein n=1 Tax=Helicobacter sp. MIT 21-1697 TaxID=2993733 RepID=UPI00224B9494|nr:hypothetical protein [Helicobacter sp. MIT 21-1697]MCX2717286.1 hypothetical protein [Helicobacter sp. MIT 21-1697]